jgi:hypothetical protein
MIRRRIQTAKRLAPGPSQTAPPVSSYLATLMTELLWEGVILDHDTSKAGWDIYVFGAPLIALLFFGFFRLDQVFMARKHSAPRPRHRPAVVDKDGASMRSDPDGRSWDKPAESKRDA